MAEVSFEAWRGGGGPYVIMGVPTPSRTLPQDTRGRGEGENRGRKERNKGGEERRGLKTLTRRYPATQGRRIVIAGLMLLTESRNLGLGPGT